MLFDTWLHCEEVQPLAYGNSERSSTPKRQIFIAPNASKGGWQVGRAPCELSGQRPPSRDEQRSRTWYLFMIKTIKLQSCLVYTSSDIWVVLPGDLFLIDKSTVAARRVFSFHFLSHSKRTQNKANFVMDYSHFSQ